MQKSYRVVIGIMTFILCANFSQQPSGLGKEKPAINFHGRLQEFNGQETKIDNITIDRMYKNIPAYAKPEAPTMNPADDTTLLDLNELQEIRPALEGTRKILEYNGRNYIEIMVTSKGGRNKRSYIIEASRKLMCDVPDEAGPFERTLSLDAFQKVTIDNYTSNESSTNKNSDDKKQVQREYECAQAGKALRDLEQESEKVSGEEKGILARTIDSVKNWVGGICNIH